jgi:hypothetical protein
MMYIVLLCHMLFELLLNWMYVDVHECMLE